LPWLARQAFGLQVGEGNPPMTITLREIAQLVGGRLEGDGTLAICGAAIIRDAQPGDITLADNPKLAPQLAASSATAALVSSAFAPIGMPFIAVDDVHGSFAKVLKHLRPERRNEAKGVDRKAEVDVSAILAESTLVGPGAKIGPRVVLGDNVTIGSGAIIHGGVSIMAGCHVGADCELFPNVVLYENTVLGDRVTVHAGSVIGAYGFGYECVNGRHRRSAQLGHVEIENDVEIGAGTTIDRGTYGATRIGEGTKIDNQVMIAHNCRIGRHNLICSHVGIAGSASTGDYVVLAGQVGVRDHVHIGDRAVIMAQAGVMNDVPAAATLVGSPAIAERDQMHVWAASYKLPEMRKQLKALQRIVEQMDGPHPELSAGDSGIHKIDTLPLRESA
jgi:UDP-3-O-[3-hydroxymyristoyl] glucosamine N-acyltransferase